MGLPFMKGKEKKDEKPPSKKESLAEALHPDLSPEERGAKLKEPAKKLSTWAKKAK